MKFRILGIAWLCVAVVLEFASTLGGDASILWGWVLLIWTAPASLLSKFYLQDFVLPYFGRLATIISGAIFEVAGGYLFWFVLIPMVWPKNKLRTTLE